MDCFRHLLVKFKFQWNNLCHLVKSYLDRYSKISLDLVLIGAAVQPVAGTEPWKRYCLILYRLLGFYQYIMGLARFGYLIQKHDDLVEIAATIMVAVTTTGCYAKVLIYEHFSEVIRQSKAFISSNFSHSSDPDYDASVRRDAASVAGKVTMVLYSLLCCDQIMICIPTSARDSVFCIPKQFHALGSVTARLLQETYVCMFEVLWGCRYFCCSLTLMPLLMGLRSELMIVVRDFETIEERVQAQILKDSKTVVGTSRKLQSSNAMRWKHLKQTLGATLEQHHEVLRNIHLLQPLVSVVYLFIYYSTLFAVAIPIFLVIKTGLTAISTLLAFTSGAFIIECYFWCKMIDSIQETMKKIADAAAQLGSRLEHSLENHTEYIQMQTSLMIVQLNASQSEWFSCGGLFPISVESFGDLCMIIYRFVTFLLNSE